MSRCYKVLNYYSLNELIALVTREALDTDGLMSLLNAINSVSSDLALWNLSAGDFYKYKIEDGQQVINDSIFARLFNLIVKRFGTHYVAGFEEEEISAVNNNELKKWQDRFVSILFLSKDKYYNILKIYQDNIDVLMNPVKITRSESGEHDNTREDDFNVSSTSKGLFNDTPETTDVIATLTDNQFASNVQKAESSTDNGGTSEDSGTYSRDETTEDDRKTTMERIKDIQDSFMKVMLAWTNEFDAVFLEESQL